VLVNFVDEPLFLGKEVRVRTPPARVIPTQARIAYEGIRFK